MLPSKRLQNNNSSDSGRPATPTQGQGDYNPGSGDDVFNQSPGKVLAKASDSGHGDSGESLYHDNNLLSPALSTGSGENFTDNLKLSSVSTPQYFGKQQTVPNIASSIMSFPDDTRGTENISGGTRLMKDGFVRADGGGEHNSDNLRRQMLWMQKNLDMMKQENTTLENALANSGMWKDSGFPGSSGFDSYHGHAQNPAFLLSNFKLEMSSFKTELSRIISHLESCEFGRRSFSERWSSNIATNLQQMENSLKELLYKNLENPVDKSLISSLQSRLKSTEERLKLNRRDVTDNLSKVEEKLLIENAECKMSENDVRRKLQQTTVQVQAMKKKHQNLIEMCQRLKVRSSENGFIDVQELLKRFAVDDVESKSSDRGPREDFVARDLLQELKDENSKQISSLVSEKHLISSELNSMNDENALMRLENDRLKKSLNELNANWRAEMEQFKRNQSMVIQRVLQLIEGFTNEVQNLCRCDQESSSIVKVLEDVLKTKERLLSSALTELDRVRAASQLPKAEVIEKPPLKAKQNTEHLTAIFDFMKLKLGDSNASSSASDPWKDKEDPSFITNQTSYELSQLNQRCSELKNELEFAEKNLEFQQEQVEKLQSQANSYQDELRHKSQALEISTNNEIDLKRELKTNKDWIDTLNAHLLEREKELKLMELDKGSVQRILEKDKTNLETKGGADDDDGADVKFIKQALELDLMASRNALDNSLKENLQLKQSLDQASRDLAAEREVTSATTYDKLVLQQQVYTALQERDAAARERDQLQNKNSLLQLENKKLSSLSKNTSSDSERELQIRLNNTTSELAELRRRLDGKEKEATFLQDTLKYVLKSTNDT